MSPFNLDQWVNGEMDPQRREFRQAVHLVLRAIAASEALAPVMIMKGGILLAIRYDSTRFTRDIDFSTPRRFQEVEIGPFLADIRGAPAPVSGDNEYGLALTLQKFQVKPPDRPDASFPTLQLKIGYANRLEYAEMQRIARGQSAKTIQIDYSFNEWASETEQQVVDDGMLFMYAYHVLSRKKSGPCFSNRCETAPDFRIFTTSACCSSAQR